MEIEKRSIDIITIPKNTLQEYLWVNAEIDFLPEDAEIKGVDLVGDRIELIFCFVRPCFG